MRHVYKYIFMVEREQSSPKKTKKIFSKERNTTTNKQTNLHCFVKGPPPKSSTKPRVALKVTFAFPCCPNVPSGVIISSHAAGRCVKPI